MHIQLGEFRLLVYDFGAPAANVKNNIFINTVNFNNHLLWASTKLVRKKILTHDTKKEMKFIVVSPLL